MSKRVLRQPINYNDYSVVIRYPDNSTLNMTFQEVQQYALEVKNLKLCPTLLKQGAVNVGSLVFYLIKVR